jgi:hypothetical protein
MDVNALVREVQKAWNKQFTSAADSSLDYWMAVTAVEAVLGAIEAEAHGQVTP